MNGYNMNNNLSITSIMNSSWTALKKEKYFFLGMSSIFFALCLSLVFCGVALFLGTADAIELQDLHLSDISVVILCLLSLLFLFLGIIYPAIMSKNILDVVYHRKSHWFILSSAIMNSTMVRIMVGSFSLVYSFNFDVIQKFDYSILSALILFIAFILSACIFYLSVRMMFVDLFVLEQNCTISQSVSHSWKMTQGHFLYVMLFSLVCSCIVMIGCLPVIMLRLLEIFGLLAMSDISLYILVPSIISFIVGLFISTPYVMLMRTYLFKALLESEQV